MSDYYKLERQNYFFGFGRQITPAIKFLLISNVVVFFFQLLVNSASFAQYLGMVPARFTGQLALWQPLTGLFLHASLWALLLDLLTLWFFAPDVEWALGSGRRFLVFYFSCGALSNITAAVLAPGAFVPILGPGGAILGVLTAFAVLFPDRVITLLLFFLIPVTMKARYLVMVFGLIEWFGLAEGQYADITRYASLAGIPIGFLLVRHRRKLESLSSQGWLAGLRKKLFGSPESREDYIRRRIDPILEKIAQKGLHSLTWRERRILRKAKTK